jgi:hypothetical protein
LASIEIRVLVNETTDADGWTHAIGEIVLGRFRERFEMSLSAWSVHDYHRQWQTAVARLKRGESPSAFVSSFRGKDASHQFIWPVWLATDGSADVQQQLWLAEQHTLPFDPDVAWRDVGRREISSDDGQKISNWYIAQPTFVVG